MFDMVTAGETKSQEQTPGEEQPAVEAS